MTSTDLGTDLAPLLEYTALAPDVTLEHVSRMCMEARTRGFTAICVNPLFVAAVAPLLQGSQTFISTVVGEPLGALTTCQKVYLATTALEEGALEIDLMVGIAALRADDRAGVRGEILAMAQVLARNPNALLKVVVDTALLDEAQPRVGAPGHRRRSALCLRAGHRRGHNRAGRKDAAYRRRRTAGRQGRGRGQHVVGARADAGRREPPGQRQPHRAALGLSAPRPGQTRQLPV